MGDTQVQMFSVPVKDLGLEKISPLVNGIVGDNIDDLDEAQRVLEVLNEAQKRLAEKVYGSQPIGVKLGHPQIGTSILAKMPRGNVYVRFQIEEGKVTSYNFNTSEKREIYSGEWDELYLKEAVSMAVSNGTLFLLVKQTPCSDGNSLGLLELLIVDLHNHEMKTCLESYRVKIPTNNGMVIKAQAIKEFFLKDNNLYIRFYDTTISAPSIDLDRCK